MQLITNLMGVRFQNTNASQAKPGHIATVASTWLDGNGRLFVLAIDNDGCQWRIELPSMDWSVIPADLERLSKWNR